MRSVATAILHDDDLAADAVQETFVHLWRRRWRLGLMDNPQGYCMRALRNRCFDIIRQHQRRNQVDIDAAETEIVYQLETDGGEEQVYSELEKAIATLPPQQKKVIELKYIEQRNIHEIVELTGLSVSNITTLLSRAYASLRQKLNNES